jgi:hypothetical protein
MTASTADPQQNLPLDDRSNALKIPIVVLIVFSSIFVLLRLGVSLRSRNFFLLTDHFLWTGHVSATTILVCRSEGFLTLSRPWRSLVRSAATRWLSMVAGSTYGTQP